MDDVEALSSHGALDLGFKVLWSKNEGTDKVLEGTAQEYESTAGANLSTAEHCLSTKSGSWDQFGSPLDIALMCLSDGRSFNWSSYIFKGMVHNISDAKRFHYVPRLPSNHYLGIETRIAKQYHVFNCQSKTFSNMRLNFERGPHATLAAILPLLKHLKQMQYRGKLHLMSPQTNPETISKYKPEPDQSQEHLPTPPRPTTSDRMILSPTSGGAEDLATLTALSSLVSELVQKVSTLDHSFSTQLSLRMWWLFDIILVPTLPIGISWPGVSSGAPTGPSTVSPGSTTVPTSRSVHAAETIPASSGTTPETPSSPVEDSRKGKGVAVEEPTPTHDQTFKQLEEERLGWEAAQRLQAQELLTEDQRKRQQEVLASAANYLDAAWDIILARLQANPDLSSIIFGVEFTDDDFAARMVELVNTRQKELAEQQAQERRKRPMTPSQLRKYMRTYVKNQGPAVYSTGWTMAQVRKPSPEQLQEEFDKIQRAVAFTRGLKRDDSPITSVSSKKLKTGDDEVHDIPDAQVEVPSNFASTAQHTASSLKKLSTKKKRLGRKGVHTSPSTILIKEGDPEAEHKVCLKYASDADSASDDDTPVNLYVVVDWELLSTGLGSINVFYRLDNSRKYFTSLREILHLVTRADLMTLYGRVMTFYQDKKASALVCIFGEI
ncbi:hypothetical protein Tco_0091875 [Tanacetum coccineum]